MDRNTRLLVVSNRLPVALAKEEGKWKAKPGSGGLVSAMAPVLRDRGGTWIGWSGAAGEEGIRETLASYSRQAGYDLEPVTLTEQEVKDYYYGFANEVIWPLFHDFQSRCVFSPDHWRSYLGVNAKFAQSVAKCSTEDDYVWVHDYHLMHVAAILKEQGVRRKTGFFLHIPFPSVDIFLKLPWRAEVLKALMEFDLVGFQTQRDRRNFVGCLRVFFPWIKARGRGALIRLEDGERTVRVGSFPIGIDYKSFSQTAAKRSVRNRVAELREAMHNRTLILGVDRLDYSKGVPERLEAMRCALKNHPGLKGGISLIQVLVPSRQEVPEYQALKEEIERLVGEINGQFSRPGYIPINYQYRSLGKEELVAYYGAADMALVTPLRDGMNLVAKEYCACKRGREGVLFLSEFAGAAAQLQNGAILVNPHHVEGVAQAIHEASQMDPAERRDRMRKMREIVRKYDIFWWVDSFLHAAFSKKLGDFPSVEPVSYSLDESEHQS